ncbi:unnamed protein product, partial [marine sediment metagenome]
KVVTPLEGIKNKVCQDTRIYFAEGCELTGGSNEGFEEAIKIAKNSSIAILFVGNSIPRPRARRGTGAVWICPGYRRI